MKNTPLTNLLILLILLCGLLTACKKGSAVAAVPTWSSFSFSANDTAINYPVNLAYIQDVYHVRTTLISGEFADTSSKVGNISIRVIGDTTGQFRRDSLLVTYTNSRGNVFTNTGDSNNYVEIEKFAKIYNGVVSGHFSLKLAGPTGSVQLSNGLFTALYQE
ncbi:hypothetical protein ACX0G9_27225 [Flavitalea flava]